MRCSKFSSVPPAKWHRCPVTACGSPPFNARSTVNVWSVLHTTVFLGDMWNDVSDGEMGNLMSVASNQMVVLWCSALIQALKTQVLRTLARGKDYRSRFLHCPVLYEIGTNLSTGCVRYEAFTEANIFGLWTSR
jgi:hypothetical protein